MIIIAAEWLILRELFYTFFDFIKEANFYLIFTVIAMWYRADYFLPMGKFVGKVSAGGYLGGSVGHFLFSLRGLWEVIGRLDILK